MTMSDQMEVDPFQPMKAKVNWCEVVRVMLVSPAFALAFLRMGVDGSVRVPERSFTMASLDLREGEH